MKEREKRLPNGLMHELNKFYYDTAQANHPGALAALLKLAPLSQILYGTDYPFWTGAEENWLGGAVPMWWSHADASTTRIWLERAGLVVEREEFISEGAGGHTLLWSIRG